MCLPQCVVGASRLSKSQPRTRKARRIGDSTTKDKYAPRWRDGLTPRSESRTATMGRIYPKQWERYQKRLASMGLRNYRDYLVSKWWSDTKKRYRDSSLPWECWVCGTKERLQLHHRSYFHIGVEPLSDLVVLCSDHHKEVHAYLDEHGLSAVFTPEALQSIKFKF